MGIGNFEFLQVAIGNRESLSVCIRDTDWQRLFGFCKRQALVGVGFAAVEKLHRQGTVCPPALRMQWMALTLQIEKQNEKLNRQCAEIAGLYEHDGLRCCVLKGQGNLMNYPEHLRKRRQSGDIDIWAVVMNGGIPIAVQTGNNDVKYVTYQGRKAVMEYVKMQYRLKGDGSIPSIRYVHIEAPSMDGTEIEVHFRVGYLNSPLRNWRLQRWMKAHADECMKNISLMGFAVPTASVNVVYQLSHLFSHFFDEGLGLRQLMDYYYTLKLWHNDCMEMRDLQSQGMWSEGLGISVMSKEEVMHVLDAFGMGKFAAAVMWVLHEAFAMPAAYDLCAPNAREGRMLLAEIMQGGNFGQFDRRGRNMKTGGMMKHGIWKWKRIMRLVGSYPEEALCEPMFRVYHLIWRVCHG